MFFKTREEVNAGACSYTHRLTLLWWNEHRLLPAALIGPLAFPGDRPSVSSPIAKNLVLPYMSHETRFSGD